MRAIRSVIAGTATAIALVGAGAGMASADPYPTLSSPPGLTTIEGVGSDTITPLFSGNEGNTDATDPTAQTSGDIAQDYDATSPASLLYSWDAVNPSTGAVGDTITTKGSSSSDTTCSIARPDGSGAGITALEANTEDDGDYCVDYARSSRGPATTDPNTIAFDPIAEDAITYASPSGGDAVEDLTVADLKAIYLCTDTNWDDFGGPDATIDPVLPQSNSGTRQTFLQALGGGTTPITPGSCVVNGTDSDGDIEENTGVTAPNVEAFSNAAAIFPYAISAYIAQGASSNGVGGHSTPIWAQGNLVLDSMTDDSGDVQQPVTTNSSSQSIINPSWVSELDRLIYIVVRNGGTAAAPAFPASPSYEASALPAIFGPNGWVCTNSTAQDDLVSYGFTSLGSYCGTLTDEQLTYGS